jgi:hypothetical protein
MKKNFVLIAALIAALTVAFVSCGDDGVVSGTGEETPMVQLFDLETGMTEGISVQNKVKFNGGILDFSDTSGSALFTVAAKDATVKSTITIKYIVKPIAGSPEFIIKNPSWSDATGAADNLFPTLEKGKVAEITVKGAGWTDPATQISFQRNHDSSNAFLMKIISVTVETPKE